MSVDNHQVYKSSLVERYSSREMIYNFSPENKFRTWRAIWVALAESEKELGLPIASLQIKELKKYINKINYKSAERFEAALQHDVMAHIKAYGEQCPRAKGIIHMGATSALVVDNADVMIMRDGIEVIKKKLIKLIKALSAFAEKYKGQPTMGFTHFQPALITTVGKRATLWLQDLLIDWENICFTENNIKCLGAKGAIGTQASFLTLFKGNVGKVKKLDIIFSGKLGFPNGKNYPVTGQTYPRKLDYQVISVFSGLAQSAHKFSNDIRLLQGLGELSEPFGSKQVGSSAMAYKRNPMKAERLGSLARFLIINSQNTAFTASQQWLERTLDDSANKRLVIPEMFLTADALLNIYLKIVEGLEVYPAIIKKHIDESLPFLITEEIMMNKAGKGGNRQDLHERVRKLSMEAANEIKDGKPNDLIKRMRADSLLNPALPKSIDAKNYIGLAEIQTEHFLKHYIKPLVKKFN